MFIFIAFEKYINFITFSNRALAIGITELIERDVAFGFVAYINHDIVVTDQDYSSAD